MEKGRHGCVVASRTSPTGNPTHNPGMCPDWESNQQPFGSQAGTQSTELHQPGLFSFFKKNVSVDLRERKKHWFIRLFMHSSVASCMCPDWGLNPRPWRIRTTLQLPELPCQGLGFFYFFFLPSCFGQNLQESVEQKWQEQTSLSFLTLGDRNSAFHH